MNHGLMSQDHVTFFIYIYIYRYITSDISQAEIYVAIYTNYMEIYIYIYI